MRFIRNGVLALLIMAPVYAAHSATNLERSRLDGRWVRISAEADGQPIEGPAERPALLIRGDQWIEASTESPFTIDATREPKEIDIKLRSMKVRAIYKLEGDVLTISRPSPFANLPAGFDKRPSTFTTKSGDPFIVEVYKRQASTLEWQTDWKKAFQRAKEERRLVFVDFYATWCGPCRMMDAAIESDAELQRRLSDFVPLRIDVDRAPLLAREYGVHVLPTFAVFDPGKRNRLRFEGGQSNQTFARTLDAIQSSAPAFLDAAELIEAGRDLDAMFLIGTAYSRLGLADKAREVYRDAQKTAGRANDRASVQIAEALGAFTYAQAGQTSRTIKTLRELCAQPVNDENAAVLSLMLGNAYTLAKDPTAAGDAYRRAQSLAKSGSTTHRDATEALRTAAVRQP